MRRNNEPLLEMERVMVQMSNALCDLGAPGKNPGKYQIYLVDQGLEMLNKLWKEWKVEG